MVISDKNFPLFFKRIIEQYEKILNECIFPHSKLEDDMNRLRCILQPRGVVLISGNWLLSDATILSEQCFRYEYDAMGRMTMKKVPGAAPVYMVYDKRGWLVMIRDGNMASSGKWMVMLYDIMNRQVQTGLWNNTDDWATRLPKIL